MKKLNETKDMNARVPMSIFKKICKIAIERKWTWAKVIRLMLELAFEKNLDKEL